MNKAAKLLSQGKVKKVFSLLEARYPASATDPKVLSAKQVCASLVKSRMLEKFPTRHPLWETSRAMLKSLPGGETFIDLPLKAQLKMQQTAQKRLLNASIPFPIEDRKTIEAIALVPLLPKFMSKFKLTRQESQTLTMHRESVLTERVRAGIEIDVEKMQPLMQGWLWSKNIYEQVLALLFATGRRTIEVLNMAEFRPWNEGSAAEIGNPIQQRSIFRDLDVIQVRHLAKQGASERFDESWHMIPVLLPASAVLHSWHELRQRLGKEMNLSPDTTPVQFNALFATKLAKTLKDSGFPVKVHDLRAIYVKSSFNQSKTRLPENQFAQDVLLHHSFDSSRHYALAYSEGSQLNDK